MKQQVLKKLTIPKSLFYKIEALNLNKTQRIKCYNLIYLLTSTPSRKGGLFLEWTPLSYYFLRLVLGSRYIDYVNILGEAGIIDCDDLFYEGKALCYRMNSSIDYSEELITVEFNYTYSEELNRIRINRNESHRFYKNLSNLKIDFNKLELLAQESIDKISIDNFTTNNNLFWSGAKEVETITPLGSRKAFISRAAAVRDAISLNMDLIQGGNGIKIMDAKEFIAQKKLFKRAYFKNCIEALKDPNTIYAKRNKTNNRLDTNFTSFPSVLLEEIYLQNDILEIDAVNSQPALLAYILEQEGVVGDDVDIFIEAAYNGEFYEYMSNKLGVDRAKAKAITFEVLFSSSIVNSDEKSLFKSCFPIVWEYIKHIKSSSGDKDAFSVKLQRLESEIFIDKILLPLSEREIQLFSKHDSIACYSKDYSDVLEHITNTYQELSFRGTLKTK